MARFFKYGDNKYINLDKVVCVSINEAREYFSDEPKEEREYFVRLELETEKMRWVDIYAQNEKAASEIIERIVK